MKSIVMSGHEEEMSMDSSDLVGGYFGKNKDETKEESIEEKVGKNEGT